jgi:hypothetical protein
LLYDLYNPIVCAECKEIIKEGKIFSDGGREHCLKLRREGMREVEIAKQLVVFKYFHENCCPKRYKHT